MLECIERFRVIFIAFARGVLHVEADNIELAPGSHLRVKLTNRAGGGVSRVCKKLLAVYLALSIELIKHGLGHIDLSAHNKSFGSVNKPEWKTSHRAQIFRHILADKSVSAGGTTHKYSVFIFK